MIIDIITYINLDYRTNKYSHINSQLNKSKIEYFKTSGIICEEYLLYPIIPEIENNAQRYKGTIGCFFAHKQAVINLINFSNNKDPNNYCLIIEDDINIQPEFWDWIKFLNIDDKHDIIFFDCGRTLKATKCIDNKQKIWIIDEDYPHFCGAFCYTIKRKNLQKILDLLNDVDIYRDLDRYLFTHKLLNNVCCQSNLIEVNYNFKSDRDPTRNWIKKNV